MALFTSLFTDDAEVALFGEIEESMEHVEEASPGEHLGSL
jgi:hypothetical protein